LFFTGLQLVGQHPTTVIPSWTARRLARAFPAWTLLAAVTSYDLKEAAENGRLLADSSYRTLSKGVKGFGAIYLGARFGAVFLDPSWPASYHAVTQVPGWAAAAILMMGLTLRSDKHPAEVDDALVEEASADNPVNVVVEESASANGNDEESANLVFIF
jgi:hypothetical protein